MGLFQKMITAVVPRTWAAAMEAESRAWKMRCKCGHETSVWEAGGIRYKGAGRSWTLWRCPHCGITWHRLYKHKPGGTSTPIKANHPASKEVLDK